ncbi:MAG: protein translocase subunit SecD [Desulfovibrionales bacterium]
MSSLRWRIVVAVLILGIGLLYAIPSFVSPDGLLARILPDQQVNLGLDLKGGIHLTLEVDADKAVANKLAQFGEDIRSMARERGLVVLRPRTTDAGLLELLLPRPKDRDGTEEMIREEYGDALAVDSVEPVKEGELRMALAMKPKFRQHLRELSVDQALKTIRNRIDQFGVAEPDIRKQQDGRIVIQLPGLEDPQRAVNIIGQTAHLEFKLEDTDADIQKALAGVVPPGSELAYIEKELPNGTVDRDPIVIQKNAVLTGDVITDAGTQFDSYGQAYVNMVFNRQGARQFERITGENVGKRLAIVLDGTVHSAPVIKDKIMGGRAVIEGQFTVDEAHDLAIVLRAGSLPAPVNILYQKSVGPSLGQQSIEQGVRAALIGGALVLLFMVIYYGFAGLIADAVLFFNIVLIMAGLAGFGATLTLPGIAGIILTIGMAVDANVLVFERIREELRRGLTPKRAVDEGFSKATLTILDANVTTIIAAIILYQFGTGPIRGFAVTLSLGIVASVFTAIFVSRIVFDLWAKSRQPSASLNI